MALGDFLQKYTYGYLVQYALEHASQNVDKRQGSIAYDSAAMACFVLAEAYQIMYNLVLETYALTATGEWLEMRTQEFGITRQAATAAVKRADFTDAEGEPLAVPIGSRWSTISTTTPLIYTVTAVYTHEGATVEGAYQLTCETPGTEGQIYTGPLLPVTYIAGTPTATMSTTITPGSDTETDADLLQRYLDRINYRAFGGNIAQYREWLLAYSGVGACQVYPAWQGGGTVKVVVLDSLLEPCEPDFIAQIQNDLDPEVLGEHGTGLGYAPIDHSVTVATATEMEISVSATVYVDASGSVTQFQDAIEAAISDYFNEVRQQWGTADQYNIHHVAVYVARVTSAILSVAGVQNVTNTLLNGAANDITLTETAETSQIPSLGEVTLSAGTT